MQYDYDAAQISVSEEQRRRQIDDHLQYRSRYQRELDWRRSQYNNAVLREKSLTSQQTKVSQEIDNLKDRQATTADADIKLLIGQEITEATAKYNSLAAAIANAKAEQAEFGSAGQEAAARLQVIGEKVTQLARQLGTRIFHKAMQEAQNFVKSYDAAMTEIQMVTLKTDSEIADTGKGLIKSAIQLKAPVSDVTAAATALYRQGLGDKEVESRLEDVIKFSTTAGVKAADAVKLITVSLSSGLVDSSQQAMDVISALGDSAATTAAEITKGLQKSIYAAKDVGVTYSELVSMLTAITAGTQLGGNIAGTAMQTFMSRYARIGTNEIAYDENGNEISGSNLSTALRSIGIETYKNGSRREFTEVLRELAGQWSDLSDAKRGQISYAFGGTRQYSNLNALLTAFGERDENGKTAIDKYLDISADSSGITDEKYTHYTESLAAAVTNLKNSFDGLIESLTNTSVITGFLDFISNAIQGITQLNTALGGVPGIIAGIAVALTALDALAKTNKTFTTIALIVGGVALAGNLINVASKALTPKKVNPNQNYDDAKNAISAEQTYAKENIKRAKEINERRDANGNLNEADKRELVSSLNVLKDLGMITTDASGSIDTLAASAEKTAKALEGASTAANSYTEKQKQQLYEAGVQDIYDSEEAWKKGNAKLDANMRMAADALNYHPNQWGNVSYAMENVASNIDWTGMQPVRFNNQTYIPSQLSASNIVEILKKYYRDPEAQENQQYKQIAETYAGIVNGTDTTRYKKNTGFGTYNKESIAGLVKEQLTGTEYESRINDITNAVVSNLDNGGKLPQSMLDFAKNYVLWNPETSEPLNVNAIAATAYDNTEEHKKIAAASVYDKLYKNLMTGKNLGVPIDMWIQNVDKNLFDYYMNNNAAVADAFANMTTAEGKFNGNQDALENFYNAVASAGNLYSGAGYRNKKTVSTDALSILESLKGGKDLSDIGSSELDRQAKTNELKTILGEELYSQIQNGNFTHYEQVRKIELETLIAEYEKQQAEIAHLEEFINRFGYKATKAAQAQERQKMLDKLLANKIEIPENLKKIHFSFPQAPHSGQLVLTLKDICKNYGNGDVDRIIYNHY